MRGIPMLSAALVVVASTFAVSGPASAGVDAIYQTDEWATEKHVPVIECPDVFVPGEMTEVTVEVGKEIEHPNTTEHHIRWIRLYFLPEGSPFAYEVGSFDFGAHGESSAGPNTSTIYTNHKLSLEFRTEVPGTLYATAFCNIHGLWESSKAISIGG
jgi:superoxide reductase